MKGTEVSLYGINFFGIIIKLFRNFCLESQKVSFCVGW